MPRNHSSAVRTLSLLAAVAVLTTVATLATFSAAQTSSPSSQSSPPPVQQQTASPAPATPQTAPAAPPPAQAGQSSVLQVKTRLVAVDVVATNSHGIVRDLKPEDFELSDGGRQKIEKFAFIDKSASAATAAKSTEAAQPHPKGFYTNQSSLERLAVPPTIVLMDSLNTNIANLAQTRHHMLSLLKTLPSNTPVAVFILGQSLMVVQSFTSDPALLNAAVDKAMRPSAQQDPMPQDDPNSLSLAVFDANDEQEDDVSQLLEDFEKQSYADQMDIRVRTTLDALTAIAHYLSAYQGRKNLIWVSESFPVTLWPDADFGTNTGVFKGAREYGDEVQAAANALTDAQVAVYPVDARGLDASQVFSAEQNNVSRPNSRSRNLSSQLRRENEARTSGQQTMESLAEGTGGKTCKNTNNLSGCVESALNDSSSFYELAYYPENVKWDGSFHKISLKTTRSGVKLSYRRGYFAQDEEALAKAMQPEKRLQETCKDFLPSTEIPLAAQVVAPQKADEFRFRVAVPSSGLNFAPDGDSYKLNAEMAICVYIANGNSFRFFTRDLSQTLTGSAYQSVRTSGLSGYMDFPKTGTERVRIAVLDETTGLVGALDVPIRADDFEKAAAPLAAPAGATLAKTPASPAPIAPQNSQPPTPLTTAIGFRVASGKSSELNWGGAALVYKGELEADQAAMAFFGRYVLPGLHCQAGALAPNDPAGHAPTFRFAFGTDSGGSAIVNLKGDHPEYSGAVPVDASAQPFFERLWSLCHCQSAP
jgi:VWFA-related protein